MSYGLENLFGGVRVFSNSLVTVPEPVKKHRKTHSMSESYHQRVQKKWVKRYGTKMVPGAYQVGRDIVAHPDIVEAMRSQIPGRASL